MLCRFSSLTSNVSTLLSSQPSFFIALLLFGQVFCSTFAYFLGIENRLVILPFRALIALYSLYIILRNFLTNKSIFIEAFPLSLAAFWFFYFTGLVRDHFVLGISTALPIWEFLAWGIGGCFLPSLACYLLFGSSERGPYVMNILSLGFLLLGSSTLFFAFSADVDLQRFQLPSLNPINASHSFFVLSLLAVSCLAYRCGSAINSFGATTLSIFGVSMGIYAGSRGALLAFACSFMTILLLSRFNKLWAVLPLFFSVFLLFRFNPSDLINRLISVGGDVNSVSRLSAFAESIKVFLAHPFFGAGFGYHLKLAASVGYPSMWYPHNFIFESLALGGLVLTAPLVVCIFLSVWSCISFLNNFSASELWRIAILVQALGYVTFSGHLSNVPIFWAALGIASSLAPVRLPKMPS